MLRTGMRAGWALVVAVCVALAGAVAPRVLQLDPQPDHERPELRTAAPSPDVLAPRRRGAIVADSLAPPVAVLVDVAIPAAPGTSVIAIADSRVVRSTSSRAPRSSRGPPVG